MKITIGHLYPDLLNLYGDRGNIQCLMKRCQWRGIEAETIPFELDDKIDFSKLDIVLLGGGSDREQMIVCEKLQKIQPDFKAYVEERRCHCNLRWLSVTWEVLQNRSGKHERTGPGRLVYRAGRRPSDPEYRSAE